ncbi:MAG: hypothetical protein AAF696_29445, partial [Bacteroidota bacterium]
MKRINWPDQILNFIGVILGVLLAFYITEIAENSKEKKEIKEFLTSFIGELDADIEAYDGRGISLNEEQSKVINQVIRNIQKPSEAKEEANLNFDVYSHDPYEST